MSFRKPLIVDCRFQWPVSDYEYILLSAFNEAQIRILKLHKPVIKLS